jgi:hypothetical protein
MTTGIQSPAGLPTAAGAEAVETIATPAQKVSHWRRNLIILGVIVLLLVGSYVYAWSNAAGLTSQYLSDADGTYQSGKYLDALVGSESFDPATNKYVTRGGYLQVEKIWKDPYAWPVPGGVDRAQARIDEIINRRLTVDQAEQFIEANTGKQNPYFGVIYLRLGELYEKENDTTSAKDVYKTIIDSFSTDPDLVAQAKDHLAKLGGK